MPGENGLVLARELRDRGGVAVIMLTASGETIDRIVGLEVGADDYLAKPFDPRELLARIRSVLRRVKSRNPAAAPARRDRSQAGSSSQARVRFGRCLIDLEARRLFEPDGTEVPITAMQFSLMEVFLNHPNRVLSRDRLLELAHKRGDEPFDRSIDIRIARLRRKIEENPESPRRSRRCMAWATSSCRKPGEARGSDNALLRHLKQLRKDPPWLQDGLSVPILRYCRQICSAVLGRLWNGGSARKALEESERRFRAIVEDQTEMICRIDRDLRVTFCNRAHARFCGLEPDRLLGAASSTRSRPACGSRSRRACGT